MQKNMVRREVPVMIGNMFGKVLNEQNLSEQKKDEMMELLYSGKGYTNPEFVKYMGMAEAKFDELMQARIAEKEAAECDKLQVDVRPKRNFDYNRLPIMVANMFCQVMAEYGLSEEQIQENLRIVQDPEYMHNNEELETYMREASQRLDELVEARQNNINK